MTELYDNFRLGTVDGLRNSKKEVKEYTIENIKALTENEGSTNEMANGKAFAFVYLQNILYSVLFDEVEKYFEDLHLDNQIDLMYLRELKQYSLLRSNDLINEKAEYSETFSYDFIELQNRQWQEDPQFFKLRKKTKYRFSNSDEQKELLKGYISQYGNTFDGLGRILMRTPIKQLFRTATP